jgi:hypothetical protein
MGWFSHVTHSISHAVNNVSHAIQQTVSPKNIINRTLAQANTTIDASKAFYNRPSLGTAMNMTQQGMKWTPQGYMINTGLAPINKEIDSETGLPVSKFVEGGKASKLSALNSVRKRYVGGAKLPISVDVAVPLPSYKSLSLSSNGIQEALNRGSQSFSMFGSDGNIY